MKQTLLCAALMAGIAASNYKVGNTGEPLSARLASALDEIGSHSKLARVLAQAEDAARGGR